MTKATADMLNAMPDPTKLRALAYWFDIKDREAGVAGDEVQRDLRRWADLAEQIRAKYGKKGK